MSPPRFSSLRIGVVCACAGSAAACEPSGFLPLDVVTRADLRAVCLAPDGSRRALIAGERGAVLELEDTTLTDTSTDVDPGPDLPAFYGAAWLEDGRYIAGDDGALLVRTDESEGYEFDEVPPGPRLWTLISSSEAQALAAGERARVLRSPGSGWTPVDINAPRDARMTGGWAMESRAVLTSDLGLIFEGNQDVWSSQLVVTETSSAALPLFDAWTAGPDSDLWVVGLGGAIFRRSPDDLVWRSEPSPTTQDLYGLFGTAPDRVFAVGASGTMLRFDGVSWTAIPAGTSQDLFAIDGTPNGGWTVAVGGRGTVVLLEE